MFKRILCALLAALTVTAFAACGKKEEKKKTKTDGTDSVAVESTVDTKEIKGADTNSTDTNTDTNSTDTNGASNNDKKPNTAVSNEEVTEKVDPAVIPEGFTEVEVTPEIKANNLRFKNVSVSKIGSNYVFNVIYATVQGGRYFVRTVNDPMLFDMTGEVRTSATGEHFQIDIPEETMKKLNGETLEIGFLLENQVNLDDYKVKIEIDKILDKITTQTVTSLNLPINVTAANDNEDISLVKATKEGDTYHFAIGYTFAEERKLNVSYPVNENTIDITKTPSNSGSEVSEDEEIGKNDPKLSGRGTYTLDYKASELKDEKTIIIRFYAPDNIMDAITLVIDINQLGRLG